MKIYQPIFGTSLLLASSSIFADCYETYDSYPNLVIPVHIEQVKKASTNADYSAMVVDYQVNLGADNEMFEVCVSQPEATILLVFDQKVKGFEFEDIEFIFENSSDQFAVPQYEVAKDYIKFSNLNTVEGQYKYNIVMRDKANGVKIVFDPVIVNKEPK